MKVLFSTFVVCRVKTTIGRSGAFGPHPWAHRSKAESVSLMAPGAWTLGVDRLQVYHASEKTVKDDVRAGKK